MILRADVTHAAPSHKVTVKDLLKQLLTESSITNLCIKSFCKLCRARSQVLLPWTPNPPSQYAVAKVQESGQNEEFLQDMKNVVNKLLKQFNKITKKEPQVLVLFRDGVSEGQFTIVMARELVAIRAACWEV